MYVLVKKSFSIRCVMIMKILLTQYKFSLTQYTCNDCHIILNELINKTQIILLILMQFKIFIQKYSVRCSLLTNS